MFRTLAPSAEMPPSANANAWTAMTTAITSEASHGPSSTAASVAPRKWPLVPPAIGKLSICAAKMKAARTPSSGTRASSSSTFAIRRAYATAAIASAPQASATPPLRNPSGMWRAIGMSSIRGLLSRGVQVSSRAQSAQSPRIGKWLKRAS